MKESLSVRTLWRNEPDDLFVAATSFEERCLGVARSFAPDYSSKLTVIAHIRSNTSEDGESRKRRFTRELYERLTWVDGWKRAVLQPVDVADHRTLWDSVVREAEKREIELAGGRISIDISCFTRIHVALLLRRALDLRPRAEVRVFYTLPVRYITEEDSRADLVYGQYRVLIVPFESVAGRGRIKGAGVRRVCVVSIGHEGDRILNIWRQIDPERTYVVFARGGSPRAVEITRKRNQYFLEQLERRDPSFRLVEVAGLDVLEVIRGLGKIVKDEVVRGEFDLAVVPFGPKSICVALAEWGAADPGCRIDLAYSIPHGYNGRYSSGIRAIFERTLERGDR